MQLQIYKNLDEKLKAQIGIINSNFLLDRIGKDDSCINHGGFDPKVDGMNFKYQYVESKLTLWSNWSLS